jgi:hypothetical protein
MNVRNRRFRIASHADGSRGRRRHLSGSKDLLCRKKLRRHARAMGFEADREAPFFFLEPADAIFTDGGKSPTRE